MQQCYLRNPKKGDKIKIKVLETKVQKQIIVVDDYSSDGTREKIIKNRGSAIFLHLTKNYRPTAGCIALKKKDFLILIKLINKKTKIKIL